MVEPLPCPSCGRAPRVVCDWMWVVACDNCADADYDWDAEKYVSVQTIATGKTCDAALQWWNERVGLDD